MRSAPAMTAISPVSSPPWQKATIHDAWRPSHPGGASSAVYTTEVPYSPPMASPCTTRSSVRIAGAAMPIIWGVGAAGAWG